MPRPKISSGLKKTQLIQPDSSVVSQPATSLDPNATLNDPKAKPAARRGLVQIAGHFPPEVRRQMKIISALEDKSTQALLTEALNLLFEHYGKPPIA
jgi:hypothetical protein